MWDLPGPEIEPISPALAGRFFTTERPGKHWWTVLIIITSSSSGYEIILLPSFLHVRCIHSLAFQEVPVMTSSSKPRVSGWCLGVCIREERATSLSQGQVQLLLMHRPKPPLTHTHTHRHTHTQTPVVEQDQDNCNKLYWHSPRGPAAKRTRSCVPLPRPGAAK